MFYHQVLLQRRGQFGIIWMEAMQSSPYRITKRKALQVNVKKSCSRITEYINAQVRDERGKRTRFSLYLSAHLMYGVISIWRKQIHVLLADAQEVKSRVGSEIDVLATIDIRQLPRHDQVNIPDALSKVADEDPFFGSLKRFNENWDTFLQAQVLPEVSSPSLSLSPPRSRELLSDVPVDLEPDLGSPHTVSSKADITMKELPFSISPFQDIPIPGEVDLPESNGHELGVMGEQPEDVSDFNLQDLPPEIQTVPPPQPQMSPARDATTPEKAKTKKVEERPKGEKRRRKRDADDLDHTQVQEPTPPKQPAREQKIILEPVLEFTPPRQGRPRRRLMFLDDKKELTKSEIRQNFSTTDTICRKCVLPQPSFKDTPARLFNEPGTRGISKNPVLRRMWEKNCQSEETDSEWDLPVYEMGNRMFLDRRRGESSLEEGSSQDEGWLRLAVDQPMEDVHAISAQMGDTPSIEAVREGTLSRSRTPQHSSLHLPVGQSPVEDPSISLTGTRGQADRSREGSRRAASLEQGSVGSGEDPSMPSILGTSSAPLEVLPEEIPEEMLLSPPFMPILPEENLSTPQMRFIRQCEERGTGRYTTFRAMCPPKVTSRPRAAKCFIALLEQCARASLFVRQRRPYGEIYISTNRRTLPKSPR